jgi:uncharacterized protein (UPF0262 family)
VADGPPAGREARIARMVVETPPRVRLSPQIEHERRGALYDLLENNRFALCEGPPGPYVVHLSLDGERLSLRIRSEDGRLLERALLPLAALKRLIKDYFLVCETYFSAIKTMSPSRIEAIDMGRRGLHDEGARLLQDTLQGRVEMDRDTARRLFTLVCVLHIRS